MKLLLLLSFVLAIHAHSWMRTPPGKYVDNATPSASQVAPCGEGAVYPAPTTIYAGRFFDVSWENNGHDNSNEDVTIRLLNLDQTEYMVVATTDYPSGSDTAGDPDPYKARLSGEVVNGSYILQWVWSGWYTCARVEVEPDPNPTILVESGETASNAATAEFVYYESVLEEPGHHVFVEIEGPSGGIEGYLQVVMSKDTLPTLQDFEEMADTSGEETIAFGGCNDEDSTTFYIGVIGMSGATGPYQLTATSYDATVNSNQEQDSPAHTGYRYYKTDSFETFDAQRRTVIESDGEINQDDDYLMAFDCAMSEGVMRATMIGDSVACWQLPEDEETKYFQVPAQENSYTIRTEEGSCEEIDGAVSVVASFALVLLLLVL